MARRIPKRPKKIFVSMNHRQPSISNVNITPGIRTKPHENIVAVISPTKLFARRQQEIRVNMEIDTATAPNNVVGSVNCPVAMIEINETTAGIGPRIKDIVRLFLDF